MIFTFTLFTELTTINHPVHIMNREKEMSPSAFIPFCDFGGNMSSVGVKIDQFDVPVCNSFQAKILNDQLCYEVDLNKFSNNIDKDKELKLGLNFIMDYNEDRQVTFNKAVGSKKNSGQGLIGKILETSQIQYAHIYFDTIGKFDVALQLEIGF